MAYALVAGRESDLRTVFRCFCTRDWRIARVLQRTGLMRAIGEESIFAASANLGGSFKQAWGAAQEIVNKKKQIA
jgi:molybdenum-dependent DNA-binding transcriptional regulator ModE